MRRSGKSATPAALRITRVQTGIRIEKRLLKVLKALAEHLDLTLGDLLEGIVLHAFDGRPAFSPATRRVIGQLRNVYGLDLHADASHRLEESPAPRVSAAARRRAPAAP